MESKADDPRRHRLFDASHSGMGGPFGFPGAQHGFPGAHGVDDDDMMDMMGDLADFMEDGAPRALAEAQPAVTQPPLEPVLITEHPQKRGYDEALVAIQVWRAFVWTSRSRQNPALLCVLL